jgi:outer membrane protein OmpA-like peptidoglycan-associated protein
VRNLVLAARGSFRVALISLSCSGLSGACAGTYPPDQLVQARRAYWEAQASEAAQYDLAALYEAEVALARAEQSYKDDANAARVKELAYVALRCAQRAKIEGQTASLEHRTQLIKQTTAQAQAKQAEAASEKLSQAREQLEQAREARYAAEARANEELMNLRMSRAIALLQEKPQGTVLTVAGAFLFRSGDAQLLPAASEKLDTIARALKEQGERKILIEGYTDSTGSQQRNLELSKQRAEAVANYLAAHGVPRDKLTTEGRGSNNPVATNDTPEGRADNRRVEITIQHGES